MRWKHFARRNRRAPLTAGMWTQALARCPYARALNPEDQRRLRAVTNDFLERKSFEGAASFEPTGEMRAAIAVKACVLILNLNLDYYEGWRDIVVYPGDFRVRDEYMDADGIVHQELRELCGQSLAQGPMVLSWQTIVEERSMPDRDLVMHECAHKLDILNGGANGFPPLHAGMSSTHWSDVFTDAFERFGEAVENDEDTALDPYGASDPAEFFAVLTETFFTEPKIIYDDFPDVYVELTRFYRQEPHSVLERAS